MYGKLICLEVQVCALDCASRTGHDLVSYEACPHIRDGNVTSVWW